MTSKKTFTPIFFLLLVVLLPLQSCKKKQPKTQAIQHNTIQIDCLISVGHKHFEKNRFDSSYCYFDKANKLAIYFKDTSRILHSLAWKASCEMNKASYLGCEQTIVEGLPYTTNSKKYPFGTWNVYNTLGTNYIFLYDFENALKYHIAATKLKVDIFLKNMSLNNIAFVYMEKQDYRKAIAILQPLTLKKEVLINPIEFARITENLGYCYFKIKNPKSINYLNKAIEIKKQKKYEWGLITSYIRLAEFYMEKSPNLAFNYSRLAYDKATKIKDINDKLISLQLIIKSSEGSQSKKYALEYIRINDSNNKALQIAKNQFAKIRYDSKKEKQENQKLKIKKIEAEIKLVKQKNSIYLMFFLSTITISISLFTINRLKNKNKIDKIKTAVDTEVRISKKLHDEVAGEVFYTLNFAETKDLSCNQNKKELISNLENIYSTTRNISRENNSILKWGKFDDELKEMISTFNTESVNILVKGLEEIDWKKLEEIKKTTIYRLIQELLINMKKHSKCSLVVLNFKKNKKYLDINYSDNGTGTHIDKIFFGNGLQNVKNRILDVNGNITFETEPNKGFKSIITIPL